jgi:hypothetical protein
MKPIILTGAALGVACLASARHQSIRRADLPGDTRSTGQRRATNLGL